MLKKISLIEGIGTFSKCSANHAEFRKTSLLFGPNSYGKSTLSEIFRSIETGDLAEVAARQTIPGPVAQRVTFQIFDGIKEQPLVLDKGTWTAGMPGGYTVHVFDSSFVGRNLFAGRKQERENKEAFSSFVLGERGVQQATAIAESKQNLAQERAKAKQLRQQIGDVGDLDAFVGTVVEKTVGDLQREVEPLRDQHAQLRRNLQASAQIRNRPALPKVPRIDSVVGAIKALNVTLGKSSEENHEAAREQVIAHMRDHMNGDRGANEWLRSGQRYVKTDRCPFCEQDLASAGRLMDAYRKYFSEGLNALVEEVIRGLEGWDDRIAAIPTEPTRSAIDRVQVVLAGYPEIHEKAEYKKAAQELADAEAALKGAIDELLKAAAELQPRLRDALRAKRQLPIEASEPLDFARYEAADKAFVEALQRYNPIVDALNRELAEFKAASNDEAISAEITRVRGAILAIERSIHRVQVDGTCAAYAAASAEAKRLEAEIPTAEAALDKEQAEFLDQFFKTINDCFAKFGSKYFTIERGEIVKKGYQPVVSLVVKFNGEVVDAARLGSVFSESDRRSLALAMFWAKIISLTPAEKEKAIVILDDPVTSFDDNRISAAIRHMRSSVVSLRQLIVLTHYSEFAKRWLEVEAVGGDFSLNILERNDKTSSVAVGDAATFLDSEHQKAYQRIADFINRKSNGPIDTHLRIFFENEVRDRFYLQLNQLGKSKSSFSDVIDALYEDGLISDEVAKQAHGFREDLNPAHHTFASRSVEDWRSLADDLRDFIYEDL